MVSQAAAECKIDEAGPTGRGREEGKAGLRDIQGRGKKFPQSKADGLCIGCLGQWAQ